MKLDDLGINYNSTRLSKILADKFDIKLNFDQLSVAQLQSLKENVSKAHKLTIKKMPFNSGHRNPDYLEQVALLEAIELAINEADGIEEGMFDKFRKRMAAKGQLKDLDSDNADDAEAGLAHIPSHRRAARIHNVLHPNKPKRKLPHYDAPRNYELVRDLDEDEKAKAKEMKKEAVKENALTGRQSSALLKLVGSENLSKAKQAIRLASEGKSVPSNLMHGFKPLVEMLLDIMQGGSGYARRLQLLDKQAERAAGLNEGQNLFEGEMEKAQLVMAVKDMVDRVQGMVEDLSKMKVEDLIALTDKMRDEFGQEAASNFMTNASTTLTNAIDTLSNARTEMDNAALGLTGQVAPEMPGATPGADPTALPADPAAAGAADPNAMPDMPISDGGDSMAGTEPGRPRRESREFRKSRILESNRFLGKLSK